MLNQNAIQKVSRIEAKPSHYIQLTTSSFLSNPDCENVTDRQIPQPRHVEDFLNREILFSHPFHLGLSGKC